MGANSRMAKSIAFQQFYYINVNKKFSHTTL